MEPGVLSGKVDSIASTSHPRRLAEMRQNKTISLPTAKLETRAGDFSADRR